MFYRRKRSQQVSIFRHGQVQGSGASGLQTITFSVPIFAGDMIFLNHRCSTGTMTSAPGWTVLGNITGLFSAVRIVQPTDTGTYTFTMSGGANHSTQCMIVAGTLGYTNYSMTSFAGGSTDTLPPISIQKNSTVLIYFTNTGAINATGRFFTPSDYIQGIAGTAMSNQSIYKQFFEPTSEGFSITWTGGTGPPDNVRIVRVEILGAT